MKIYFCNNKYKGLGAYLVIPCLLLVVDDCSPETSGGVDTSASDWNGGKVNHEDSKSNWKWCQDL